MKRRNFLVSLFVVLAMNLLHAQAPPPRPGVDVFEQNRCLGRGVNILGYDPIWRDRQHGRFQLKYFSLLKEAGFQTIRINLHPFSFMSPTNNYLLPSEWIQTLNWVLVNADKQGLNTILDLHEFGPMGDNPATNEVKFLAFWRQISQNYWATPPSVFFEILNEPSHKLTPDLWNEYLKEALAVIREKNPNRTVIVGPAFWNSIDHLKELALPAEDKNLIVTVHYYQPMDFTHQGAAWANRKDKLGVDWLGTPQDQAAIEGDFDKADDWSKKNHRPIFLGEFGAYDKGPMDSRARYTANVARAAEKRGWSWAYWQFDSDFIVYDVSKDAWVQPIKEALIPSAVK